MKNRKLFHACIAGVLSAAMLMTSISVWGAEFTDGAEAQAVVNEEAGIEELELEEFEAPEGRAADIAINTTAFPDKAFRTYVLDKIDTDKNSKLSAAEIKAVTTLNVNGLGIANLKGIEKFTYLQELYAANNNLTALDLSKNTKIVRLNVDSNKLKTLDLSKITAYVETLKYSNNQLTKVTMPARKYLKSIDYINASHNKFTTQAAAGLNISAADELEDLSEIDASYNSISAFSCSGFKCKVDLSNNKLTTLKEGELGFLATGLYIEGKNNTLSKTSSVDFSSIWNEIPQEFSCNPAVEKKVIMAAPKLSVSGDWDKMTVTVGTSSDDATVTLYRKEGSGSYVKLKTWAPGELENTEFDENKYVDTNISAGKKYTYKATASIGVQGRNKVVKTWSKSIEKAINALAAAPAITVKSSKKGVAAISWKEIPGADGYAVYSGTSKTSVKTVVTKNTTKLSVSKSKLTSGKSYYFRVRAFKNVNGKPVYAPYSAVKGVKVK